jgi:hypothetical protein
MKSANNVPTLLFLAKALFLGGKFAASDRSLNFAASRQRQQFTNRIRVRNIVVWRVACDPDQVVMKFNFALEKLS